MLILDHTFRLPFPSKARQGPLPCFEIKSSFRRDSTANSFPFFHPIINMPAAKMVRCEPCDRSFESDADLYTHITYSRHHALDCFRCRLSFNSTAELEHHRSSPPKHNLCYACDPPPDFACPEQLSRHEAEVHNVCTECHMAFDRHDDLEYHTEAQHCVCRMCKRKFGSASVLENVSLP